MRVTNKMTSELVTRDLYRAQQLLLDAQVRVSTGKRINKPSDDPIGMGKVLDYRKILSKIEQYNENISYGKNQLEFTSTILDEIETLLNDAQEWALKYSTGSDISASAAQNEVAAIYDHIMDLANTKIENNYIFAGHETNTIPFTKDASYNATYAGDDGDVNVLVGDNVQVKINATGTDIFYGGADVFSSLKNVIDAIAAGDPTAAYAEVANLQSAIDQAQNVSTENSIYYGRLDASENFLVKYKSNIEDMLTDIENTDPAQAIIEMQLQETAYTTCLETASRIIQSSLVDFVK
jgi:flagellar hook-associated protein 3 FlgL